MTRVRLDSAEQCFRGSVSIFLRAAAARMALESSVMNVSFFGSHVFICGQPKRTHGICDRVNVEL